MPLKYTVNWGATLEGWPLNQYELVEISQNNNRSANGEPRINRKRLGEILDECLGDTLDALSGRITQSRIAEYVNDWLWDHLYVIECLNDKKIARNKFCEAITEQFNVYRKQNRPGKKTFGVSLGVLMEGSPVQYILDEPEPSEHTFEDVKNKIEDCLSEWAYDNGITAPLSRDCFTIIGRFPAPLNEESMNAAVMDHTEEDHSYWLEVFFWADARGLANNIKSDFEELED